MSQLMEQHSHRTTEKYRQLLQNYIVTILTLSVNGAYLTVYFAIWSYINSNISGHCYASLNMVPLFDNPRESPVNFKQIQWLNVAEYSKVVGPITRILSNISMTISFLIFIEVACIVLMIVRDILHVRHKMNKGIGKTIEKFF
jgi:type II secretory pathway component PulF